MRTFGGFAFIAAGLGVTALVIFSDGSGSKLGPILFAQIFVITGLLILGAGGLLIRWAGRFYPGLNRVPWETVLGGAAACLLGILFMLISIYDPRDDAFDSGRPVVFVAGLAFFLAGVAIVTPSFFRGSNQTVVQTVLGCALLTTLGAVPAFIFFHDGSSGETPAAPVFEEVNLTVGRETVFAGEQLLITFDKPIRMPEGYGYWVSIVPQGSEIYAYGTWRYVSTGATELAMQAPESPGLYEVRLHAYMNKVLSTQTIEVKDAGEASEVTPEHDPTPAREKERR